MIYIGERSWPHRSTPSRSAREDPWAPSDVDPAASLIMSSHERDRLTRDHRDPEIALFLLCRETLDALIAPERSEHSSFKDLPSPQVGITFPFRGEESVFVPVGNTAAMTC